MPYSNKTLIANWEEDRVAPVETPNDRKVIRNPEPDLALIIAEGVRSGCGDLLTRIGRRPSRPTGSGFSVTCDYKTTYASEYKKADSASTHKPYSTPKFITDATIAEILYENRRPLPDTEKAISIEGTSTFTEAKNKQPSALTPPSRTPLFRRKSTSITTGNDKRPGTHIWMDA